MSAGFVVAAVARRDGSTSDGIHVLWTPPATAGWSIDGWDVQRRKAEERKELRCRQLTATELQALHKVLRLELPGFGEVRLRQADCPGGMAALPDEPADRPRGAGRSATEAGGAARAPGIAAAAASAIGISTGPRKCAAYHVRFGERHRIVQVRAGLPSALAIALREGKAVDALVLTHPSGMQTARFENRDVDEVLVYCSILATSFEVCVEDARDPGRRRPRGRAPSSSRRTSNCRCARSTTRSDPSRTSWTWRGRACSPTRTSTPSRSRPSPRS